MNHRWVRRLLLANFLFWLFMFFGIVCVNADDYKANQYFNSLTGVTLIVVSTPSNPQPGDILSSILINQRGGPPGTLLVYDSSRIASGLIGTIDISTGAASQGGPFTPNVYLYDLRLSSSLTITQTGNSADITILWNKKR